MTAIAERVMPDLPSASRIGQGTAVEQSRAIAEVQAAVVVAQQVPRSFPRAERECGSPDDAEEDDRYMAYAEALGGATGDEVAVWAIELGFSLSLKRTMQHLDSWLDLTAEWKRVILARREAPHADQ